MANASTGKQKKRDRLKLIYKKVDDEWTTIKAATNTAKSDELESFVKGKWFRNI